MDKFEEIFQTSPGHYSFFIGVHQYSLSTPMEKERVIRVISKIQQLVDSFPAHLTQDQRLFLSLMSVVSKMDKLELKINSISSKLPDSGKQD